MGCECTRITEIENDLVVLGDMQKEISELVIRNNDEILPKKTSFASFVEQTLAPDNLAELVASIHKINEEIAEADSSMFVKALMKQTILNAELARLRATDKAFHEAESKSSDGGSDVPDK